MTFISNLILLMTHLDLGMSGSIKYQNVKLNEILDVWYTMSSNSLTESQARHVFSFLLLNGRQSQCECTFKFHSGYSTAHFTL